MASSQQDKRGRGLREVIVTYFLRGEAALLQKFREGDKETLEGVYRAYADAVARVVGSALRRYCTEGSHLGWRQVAVELPDLVQEVFIRAFQPETRCRFDGARLYAPFLSQITRNVVVDHLRRRWRQLALETDPFIDEISLHPIARDGVDAFADWRTMAVVDRYVADLPLELRRVHDALYVQGLSQRDAASALGIGRQVVRTLESRLRQGLRVALQEIDYANSGNAATSPQHAMMSGRQKAGGAT